ncbi:uncharacterized protein LOC126370990 isoform X2 [Pectinophora gossypiella]|nr:uncharacterized protein LOC126370990 isoform X2 [Pectinophora gossypiella]XP_049872138.1 uncharacterized protein LOC126370990 isoform X2 [Pectinophora gossypiella]
MVCQSLQSKIVLLMIIKCCASENDDDSKGPVFTIYPEVTQIRAKENTSVKLVCKIDFNSVRTILHDGFILYWLQQQVIYQQEMNVASTINLIIREVGTYNTNMLKHHVYLTPTFDNSQWFCCVRDGLGKNYRSRIITISIFNNKTEVENEDIFRFNETTSFRTMINVTDDDDVTTDPDNQDIYEKQDWLGPVVAVSAGATSAVIIGVSCWYCRKMKKAVRSDEVLEENQEVYSYVPIEITTHSVARMLVATNTKLGSNSFVPHLPTRSQNDYIYDYAL